MAPAVSAATPSNGVTLVIPGAHRFLQFSILHSLCPGLWQYNKANGIHHSICLQTIPGWIAGYLSCHDDTHHFLRIITAMSNTKSSRGN
jgi:hypothetical protein